jgi:oligopeptide/dipeptide ABC transporter ATP-binding protein
MADILLEGRNLTKHYPVTRGLLQRTVAWIRAVDGISFTIEQGKTLSLVGESGAGKTTVAKAILLLERLTSGTLLFEGKDLYKFSPSEIKRKYRPRVQYVQQNPWSSMNPRMRLKDIVAEPLVTNIRLTKKDLIPQILSLFPFPSFLRRKMPKLASTDQKIRDRIMELLEQVGLDPAGINHYPHEFSGGQRQRIAVARSLALNPDLIILDEPVSALDVSIRAQIMNLLKDLQEQLNLSYLVIAHNLATVRYMSHKMAIMYLGEIVEYGDTEEIFQKPLHPYTRALISASMLTLPEDEAGQAKQIILTGEMPSPMNPPPGCRFHTRCPEAKESCSRDVPEMVSVGKNHLVKCLHHG